MTFPIEVPLGPARLNLHLVFELLAFYLGYRYFLRLRRRHDDPISDDNRLWVFIGAAGGAFLGSRLLGFLESPDPLTGDLLWLRFFQSKTIVGGLLGGLFGVEMVKKAIGERQSSGDLFTYPLLLGMMIGRVGCFTMGVHEPTFGNPSGLPWALDLGDGIPRHPTALYEIGFLGLLWLGLARCEKKWPLVSGSRFKLFMVSYLCWRFAVAFIQPGWRTGIGLTAIQWACIAGLAYYWRVFFIPGSLLKTGNFGQN